MSSPGVSVGPFSDSLMSPLNVSRLYKPLKTVEAHDDANYKDHLVLIDSNLKAVGPNKTIQMMQLEQALIELQGLVIEGEGGEIAEELAAMAKQLFFKTAAELLAVRGSPEDLSFVPLLCSLAYQAVSCVDILDSAMIAWSAYMAIDSLTLMQAVPIDNDLWNCPSLGERLVSALLPNDGGLNRLHSRLFQQARDEADQLVPEEMGDLVPRLAERITPIVGRPDALKLLLLVISRRNTNTTFSQVAFFTQLFESLPRTLDPSENGPLGAQDLAIFLVSLATCLGLSPTSIVPQVQLTVEQQSVWASVCTLIDKSTKIDECSLALGSGKLIRCVRLKTPTASLHVLYAIYEWMSSRQFHDSWIEIYAQQIKENILGFSIPVRNTIIPSSEAQFYSTEEEQRILQEILIYLTKTAMQKGRFKDAASYLAEMGDSSNKQIIRLRYQLYKGWMPTASGEEAALVQEKLTEAEAAFRAISPIPTTAPEGVSAVSPWSGSQQQQDRGDTPPPKSPSEGQSEVLAKNEVPTSPFSADSSFASVCSSRCDRSTSTDNSFISALASPYHSDGDRTPTTIRSPSVGLSPQNSSPPEEPNHSRLNDSLAVPQASFALQEFEEDPEEFFLMEIINRKIENMAVTMKQVEKAQNVFETTIANDRIKDMEHQMEEMKAEYEKKLQLMESQLKEQKKKEVVQEKNVLLQNLANPRMILREKIEARKPPTLEKTEEPPHPGHTGFCLGCLSEDDQEKALQVLDGLSKKWNEEDSD